MGEGRDRRKKKGRKKGKKGNYKFLLEIVVNTTLQTQWLKDKKYYVKELF